MAWLCDLCDEHSTNLVRWPSPDGIRLGALCPDHWQQLRALGGILSLVGALPERGPDRWKG